MYWDAILKEVLNQDDPCKYTLTNIKEYKNKSFDSGQVQESRAQFLEVLPQRVLNKYHLGDNYPGVYFTERETQAMYHFLRGKTANEVAQHLKLSCRTVEFYLKNMKLKLGCHSKSELIERVLNSDFQKLWVSALREE